MLDKSEAVIKNGQSRDNIGHKAQRKKTNKAHTKKSTHTEQNSYYPSYK